MSVRVSAGSVVVNKSAFPQRHVREVLAPIALSLSEDEHLLSAAFESEADCRSALEQLRSHGVDADSIAAFDAAAEPAAPHAWLQLSNAESGRREAWLAGSPQGAIAPLVRRDRPPFMRHDVLSRSASGIHFVRDRKNGVLRQLSEEEMRDFSDPPPCRECGEQFGCDHFNCAGEQLLSDPDIASEVPPQWSAFARENGVSRGDLARLEAIRSVDGAYEIAPGATSDMRMLELVLLLNESK